MSKETNKSYLVAKWAIDSLIPQVKPVNIIETVNELMSIAAIKYGGSAIEKLVWNKNIFDTEAAALIALSEQLAEALDFVNSELKEKTDEK